MQNSKQIKRLFLITNDYPYGNGEGSFILPELPFLKRDFEVTIISTSLSDEQTANVDSDIKVIHYDRKASIFMKLIDTFCYMFHKESYVELKEILSSGHDILKKLKDSILFFEEARRFKRFLKRTSLIDAKSRIPTIVYSYWYTFYTYTAVSMFRSCDNVKVITRTHRYDLYDEGYAGNRQPFKRYMNRYIDEIVFIAEHGRQYFLNNYSDQKSILEDKCQLYRLGVSPIERKDKYIPKQNSNTEYVVASCALLIPRKRVELIIEGLSLIDNLNIKWIHFGDGEQFDEITELAKRKLGSKPCISYEFAGYVESQNILKYYEDNPVDVFITTTASEGCPVSVQEAMAYGIPIIGTSVAEIPYMIDGNGILLSENPDPYDVRDAIVKLLTSADRNQMSIRSWELWKDNFDSNINMDQFSKFLASICR